MFLKTLLYAERIPSTMGVSLFVTWRTSKKRRNFTPGADDVYIAAKTFMQEDNHHEGPLSVCLSGK